jgi:plasmid stabilization system protein ParE
MAFEIIYSKAAASGYARILKYLDENWTEQEVHNFEQQVKDYMAKLSKYPYLLKASQKSGYRQGPINKLTLITYKVDENKNQLRVLRIRGTKQKPIR